MGDLLCPAREKQHASCTRTDALNRSEERKDVTNHKKIVIPNNNISFHEKGGMRVLGGMHAEETLLSIHTSLS